MPIDGDPTNPTATLIVGMREWFKREMATLGKQGRIELHLSFTADDNHYPCIEDKPKEQD